MPMKMQQAQQVLVQHSRQVPVTAWVQVRVQQH